MLPPIPTPDEILNFQRKKLEITQKFKEIEDLKKKFAEREIALSRKEKELDEMKSKLLSAKDVEILEAERANIRQRMEELKLSEARLEKYSADLSRKEDALAKKMYEVSKREEEIKKGVAVIKPITIKEGIDIDNLIEVLYPTTGSTVNITEGTTTVDFEKGLVISPSGALTTLNRTLNSSNPYIRSYLLNASVDVVVYGDDNIGNKFTVAGSRIYRAIYKRIKKLYIVATSTSAISLYASSHPEGVPEQTVVSTESGVFWLDTVATTHFTGAITQNNYEDEDLTGLSFNKYSIESITISSVQRLRYRLLFYGDDAYTEFIDFVEFDLPADGFQLGGTGDWLLAYDSDVAIPYIDLDSTQEIHVRLQNVSITAKNAGAAGAVKFKIALRKRE